MSEMLIDDGDLKLRRADLNDLNYILKLQADPENSLFIVSFDRDFHQNAVDGKAPGKTSIIIEQDGERCGYFLLDKYDQVSYYIWHMIIDNAHKGRGIGRRALRLLKRWVFDVLHWHRLMIDSKDFNQRAIHLYTSEGFKREALFREALLVNGQYQNLVVFAMLRQEYVDDNQYNINAN